MAIAHGLPVTPARSVRESEWPVSVVTDVVAAVRADRDIDPVGTLAVIAAPESVPGLHESLAAEFGSVVGLGADGLVLPIVVLSPQESKGLEFDSVVLVDPTGIAAAERGASGLYVAMTRPTQRLTLVASGELPEGIDAGRVPVGS
jgi:hypothetical protein